MKQSIIGNQCMLFTRNLAMYMDGPLII